MLRFTLKKRQVSSAFRPRGVSPTCLETFSDAVFALTITLLILSSSVEADELMYGAAAASIFLLLAGLFAYALRKRQALALSAVESFDTRASLYVNLAMTFPPLLSILIAFIGVGSPTLTFVIAGIIYMIYPVIMPLLAARLVARKRRLYSVTEAVVL